MSYQVKLVFKVEREALINKSKAEPIGHSDFYEFRSDKYSLPVIRIDINIPIYRMANYRTYSKQQEYITKNKKNEKYFEKGQESESCQQIQHQLLGIFARKGKSNSVIPVIDILRKEKQREPLLISSSGVVVNGNRRLCAMRELFFEDAISYAEFSHVNCMVLPDDATISEILDIEASLQAKPETKLDYDWIGDGQLISNLLLSGKSVSEVSEKLNRGKKEIENSVQALTEAKLYLNDWAGKPREYSRVTGDGEQLFKDMPKSLLGKDQSLKDASRVIAWSLFDNRDRLPGRIYDFNAAFGNLASNVLNQLSSFYPVKSNQVKEVAGDDFDVDVDEEMLGDISYEPIVSALKNKSTKDEAVETLINVCQNTLEAKKGQKSGEAALKLVGQSHSKLAAVDLSTALENTYLPIREQLVKIKNTAEHLISTLTRIEK